MSSLSEQQASVVHASFLGLGPVVVKAGPGSGKTHTVVSLIKEHISNGVSPKEITAITFTRRAARELKERLGSKGRLVHASTIDALALDIATARFQNQRLLSPACYWVLFQVACDMFGVKATHDKLSVLEDMREVPYVEHSPTQEWSELRPVLELIDQVLTNSNYADYLGVLKQAIWVSNSSGFNWPCRLLIVDEAQDTSKMQWRLIENLVKKTRCQLVIVGDMNQNIYSWRNAAPEVFYSYATSDDSVALPLKESFRCQPKIVRASNHLIQFNPDAESDVVSVRDGVFHSVKVSQSRASVEAIGLLEELYAPEEIAILCRTNRTVDYIARELQEAGIEANAVHPVEGKIGFLAMAGMFGWDKHNIVNQILFKESARQMSYQLAGDDAESIMASVLLQPNGMKLMKYLAQCSNTDLVFAEALAELDGVPDFRSAVAELKKSVGGYYVRDAIDRLLAPGEVDEKPGAVTVSTIHQAKGLEWPVVIIADLKEGVFPSRKSTRSESGIIEERRLMYVAMTRAKDRLILCADPLLPSQFVFSEEFYNAEEIPGLGPQAIREAGW